MKKEKGTEKMVNVTVCDKQYFTAINTAQNSVSSTRYPGYAIMILCIMFGMYLLQSGENFLLALLLYFIGLIVIPIAVFIVPYNVRRRKYNAYLKGEKQPEVKGDFGEHKFRIRNFDGTDSTYQYRSIDDIFINGQQLVIKTGDKRTYYLALSGFNGMTEDEVCGFLKSHTGFESIGVKGRSSVWKSTENE